MDPKLKQRQPSVFIASAGESLTVLEAIQDNLSYDAWVRPWSQGIFTPSKSPLEVLLETVATSDFGIFVFAPNDVVRIRKRQYLQVRDNVLFELGLFTGALGRERCFIVAPLDSDLRLPTDLIGMTPLRYNNEPPDQNFVAALGTACNAIRRQIKKLGARGQSHADVVNAVAKGVAAIEKAQNSLSIYIDTLADDSIKQPPIKSPKAPPKSMKPSKIITPMK